MSGRRVTLASSLFLATILTVAAAGPVWAHEGGASVVLWAPVSAAAPAVPSALTPASAAFQFHWMALAALIVLLTVWRRSRSAAAVALALALCTFAFERGVHSVHHLGQVVQENECAVAASASHTDAAAHDAPGIGAPDLVAAGPTPEDSGPGVAALQLSTEQGRAPPAPLA